MQQQLSRIDYRVLLRRAQTSAPKSQHIACGTTLGLSIIIDCRRPFRGAVVFPILTLLPTSRSGWPCSYSESDLTLKHSESHLAIPDSHSNPRQSYNLSASRFQQQYLMGFAAVGRYREVWVTRKTCTPLTTQLPSIHSLSLRDHTFNQHIDTQQGKCVPYKATGFFILKALSSGVTTMHRRQTHERLPAHKHAGPKKRLVCLRWKRRCWTAETPSAHGPSISPPRHFVSNSDPENRTIRPTAASLQHGTRPSSVSVAELTVPRAAANVLLYDEISTAI